MTLDGKAGREAGSCSGAGAFAVRKLGLCEYRETAALQEELVAQRRQGLIPDTLLLLEHEPVITIGRTGGRVPPPCRIPVVETPRGGQATYHGPGQLVAYPILDLRGWRPDLHWYLRQLEQCGIETAAAFGVAAGRKEAHTGVWVGEWKLASIGVAVRGWVTYHGLALNVCCDLDGFRDFDPCGLPAETMTSLAELGVVATVPEVAVEFEKSFLRLFGCATLRAL